MKKIEKISIRARVAFGILCLETFIRHVNYDFSKWKLILDELWRYTSSNVGKWHEYMSEMTPFSITEKIPFSEKGCDLIDEKKHDDLQDLYENAHPDILQVINLIFEIGTRDLYASIANNSPDTVDYLNNIIFIMERNHLPLPAEQLFDNLSISENEGWGRCFTKENLLNEIQV